MEKQARQSLIYLTGFMGSGKSTIGPILANTLGYSYLDIDGEIERITGKRVTEIFLDEGEPYFRTVERSILEKYRASPRQVISLGGGTIANDENLAIIKSSGLLVYLKADLENIFHRLKYKTDRPLLHAPDGTTLGDDELRKRITEILAVREPYYRQANIVIQTADRRIGVTVDELVRILTPLIV